MTQRAIKVVSQKPLLQAFSVEDMQAPQFAYLLRAVYLLQTNRAEHKSTTAHISNVISNEDKHTTQIVRQRLQTTRGFPSW